MSLKSGIAAWDGKSSEDILAVWTTHQAQSGFISTLLELVTEPELAKGATWLLKHHLESGATLTAKQAAIVYDSLPEQAAWESRLHILQCMPLLPAPKACWEILEAFLRRSLHDPNKFVRAWAYSGLNDLASLNPGLRTEVNNILDMGLRDEPASVKARIRNIKRESE